MWKITTLLITSLMISGCSWLTKPSEIPTNKISESLLTECGKASELSVGSLPEAIKEKLHDAKELGKCRRKHNALVEQIRKVENQ